MLNTTSHEYVIKAAHIPKRRASLESMLRLSAHSPVLTLNPTLARPRCLGGSAQDILREGALKMEKLHAKSVARLLHGSGRNCRRNFYLPPPAQAMTMATPAGLNVAVREID